MTKEQANQVQGALPELGRRLAACEAREQANARALEEGRQASERAQAMLTEHRSEGARLLKHIKKIEAQLAATTTAKRELEGEVAGLKTRVASLEEGVRQRDASVHDLKAQNRELSGELEKVRRIHTWTLLIDRLDVVGNERHPTQHSTGEDRGAGQRRGDHGAHDGAAGGAHAGGGALFPVQ